VNNVRKLYIDENQYQKGKVRNPILSIAFGVLSGLSLYIFTSLFWVDLATKLRESYGSFSNKIAVSNNIES
jgi:hypothetical protein